MLRYVTADLAETRPANGWLGIDEGADAVLIVKNAITLEKYGSFMPGEYKFYNGGTVSNPFTAHIKTDDLPPAPEAKGGDRK